MAKLYVRSVVPRKELTLLVIVLIVCAPLVILENQAAFSINNVRTIGYMIDKSAVDAALDQVKQKVSVLGVKNKVDFPRFDIMVSERDIRSLLKTLPTSMKVWKSGHFALSAYEGKMKYRLRGDANVNNYFYERKSYKLNLQKNTYIFGMRRMSLIASTYDEALNATLAYLLTDTLGLPTPIHLPINLYVNGEFNGIYLVRGELNEQFLRNRNIMPVEILKGDRAASTTFSPDTDYELSLFENHVLWQKESINNRKLPSDFSGLRTALSILWGGLNVDGYDLEEVFPTSYWARYALALVLLRSDRQDNVHNQRLLFDDQLGGLIPIPFELSFDKFAATDDVNLLRISNALMSSLVKSDAFLIEFFALAELVLRRATDSKCILPGLCLGETVNDTEAGDYSSHAPARQFVMSIVRGRYPDDITDVLVQPLRDILSDDRQLQIVVDQDCAALSIDRIDGVKRILGFDSSANTNEHPTTIVEVNAFPRRITPACSLKTTLRSDCIGFGGLRLRPINVPVPMELLEHEKLLAETHLGNRVLVEIGKSMGRVDPCDSIAEGLSNSTNPSLEATDIWSGIIKVNQPLYVHHPVEIQPGTEIHLSRGASVIFKNKVIARGAIDQPIIFKSVSDEVWGTVALLGPNTSGSVFEHCDLQGGSSWEDELVSYLGMFSVHNSQNILLSNVKMRENHDADDVLHIVYSKNVHIIDSSIVDSLHDAIDVDVSDDVLIENVTIQNAGNDCVDVMTSNALLRNYKFDGCGDKGISVGERSVVVSIDGSITEAGIGIESKDESEVLMSNTLIKETSDPFLTTRKNMYYFGKGKITKLNDQRTLEQHRSIAVKLFPIPVAHCKVSLNTHSEYMVGMANNHHVCL